MRMTTSSREYFDRFARQPVTHTNVRAAIRLTPGRYVRKLVFLIIGLGFSLPLLGQHVTPPDSSAQELSVVVSHCPPFVIVENGKYSGLGIKLWEKVAAELGVSYSIFDGKLADILDAIASSQTKMRADVAISCLSITAEREKITDFSHAFYETYTGIAVNEVGITGTLTAALTSPVVLRALAIVILIAALVGGLFYALEHKQNDKLYSMKSRSGKWLEAFVVGALFVSRGPVRYYEFKTPVARILSAILAIGSTFLIAGVTAVLAGAFTLENLSNRVTGPGDLHHVRVGALAGSTSSKYLDRNGIVHRKAPDLGSLLTELDAGRLDAVVSDEAFLKYSIRQGQEQGRYQSLVVLPEELELQNYGFGLQPKSPHREAINRALLRVRSSPEWKQEVIKYIGGP